jgi:hypothetical protein
MRLGPLASVHVAERVKRVANWGLMMYQDTALTTPIAKPRRYTMAYTSPPTRTHDSDDDLDDILKDVTNPESIVQSTENPSQPQYRSNKKSDSAGGLGVDEEIVITKKRLPIPKLDDQRLLSDPGIPRLRKISKERLRFKGKGHEVRLSWSSRPTG